MLGKRDIYRLLDERGISYEVTEHAPVFTMSDLAAVRLPCPGRQAKNLFVRDDKKRNYYLICVKGDKRVDLKEFAHRQGLRRLGFASADDLQRLLGLQPGSVTPLGLLNDENRQVSLFLDRAFEGGLVGVHPNENTATVWLQTTDLVALIETHGNPVQVVEL